MTANPIISLALPELWLKEIDELVQAGYATSRQEIIRGWIKPQIMELLRVDKTKQSSTITES